MILHFIIAFHIHSHLTTTPLPHLRDNRYFYSLYREPWPRESQLSHTWAHTSSNWESYNMNSIIFWLQVQCQYRWVLTWNKSPFKTWNTFSLRNKPSRRRVLTVIQESNIKCGQSVIGNSINGCGILQETSSALWPTESPEVVTQPPILHYRDDSDDLKKGKTAKSQGIQSWSRVQGQRSQWEQEAVGTGWCAEPNLQEMSRYEDVGCISGTHVYGFSQEQRQEESPFHFPSLLLLSESYFYHRV